MSLHTRQRDDSAKKRYLRAGFPVCRWSLCCADGNKLCPIAINYFALQTCPATRLLSQLLLLGQPTHLSRVHTWSFIFTEYTRSCSFPRHNYGGGVRLWPAQQLFYYLYL